jgi:hypothetical protein
MARSQLAGRVEIMRRIGALVTAVACASLLSGCAFVSRASESSSGEQANDYAFPFGLSSDGRWLVFQSFATNLVPGDTNAATDVFVRDNWTKAVTRVSVSSTGAQGDSHVRMAAISADGRVVAFTSDASNLVPGDTNGLPDVFWHDRDADHDGVFDEPGGIATVLASARPDGGVANGFSFGVALNASGSVLAFDTEASDLLATPDGDANGENDVYAATFDLSTSQRTSMRIVSRTPGSLVDNNGFSRHPSVDWSGNLIAFETTASNLLPGDTNGTWDVVVNNGTQLLRGTGAEVPNGASTNPTLSGDGSRIAYQSTATNLVAGDTIANLEVFVTEFAFTGATKSAGTQIEDAHPLNRLSMSFNGERVAYMSIDAQIVPGDTNRTYDAFVHDFTSDVTQRISVDTYLQQAPFGGSTPHLSGDGRFVAFATGSALQPPDANGTSADIFLRRSLVPVINSVVAIDPFTHAEVPAVLHPGPNDLIIRGAAMEPDLIVGIGAGTTTSLTSFRASEVHVTVDVAANAVVGKRNLVVTNPGSTSGLAVATLQACACVTIANP